METSTSAINPGPWSYDTDEHCIIDKNGNVVAEFYEDDANGILVTNLFNENLKVLDYSAWIEHLSKNQS